MGDRLKTRWVGRWTGKTIVCIGSGPSLTVEDCEAVRRSGHTTIVCNNTFERAPWATVLFGFDARWWSVNRNAVAGFAGEKVSYSRAAGVQSLAPELWFKPFGNSGAGAASLAVATGATLVLLLGYDAAPAADGKMHWHADHAEPLTNGKSYKSWPGKFVRLAEYAKRKGSKIVNVSRQTAITAFPKASLESQL